MINYILQIILCQILFLAIYDFFLSKETFFTKNRWYLLVTPVLSFVIPLIKIPSFQKVASQEFIIQLPEIVLNPNKVIQQTIQQESYATSINYITILFWLGVSLFAVLLAIKLVKIIRLIQNNNVIEKKGFKLILLPKETKAFSFFQYIFLGNAIEKHQQEKIIQHELVHAKQRHTLDLLFFELLKIVMWFNPMIYFYQKRITLLHEYISDNEVAKQEPKEQYINNLLSSFFQVEDVAFVNQFSKKSLLKQRITMMTKNQSKKINQFKYLFLLPVLVSMLFYSACSDDFENENLVSSKQKSTMYSMYNDGKLKSFELQKETYLDAFIGSKIPKDFKEISIEDLSIEEKEEFFVVENKVNQNKEKNTELRLFKLTSGRKVIAFILDFSTKESLIETEDLSQTKEVSFMTVEQAPTFPGCEDGDKNCFSKKVQQHFAKNFNAEKIKNLGLSSGRKRVFIGFKIDTDGNIVDVQVRAPHKRIKEEVLGVMQSLPQVKPGEMNTQKVAVKYSIPFTINIE